jgi:hypothetical protein
MRKLVVQGLAAAALMAAISVQTSSPAAAFGYALGSETCYEFVRIRGAVNSSYRGAQNNAIAAWENRVRRTQGGVYANWYYSADRTISCDWNTSGSRISCVAEAGPCGPKKKKGKR